MASSDPTPTELALARAQAWIPYAIVDGQPIHPTHPNLPATGLGGCRTLGENRCVDALVTAGSTPADRQLLVIARRDTGQIAVPGGRLEQGTVRQNLSRELAEETGLTVRPQQWRLINPPIIPPDPRQTRNAWHTTRRGAVHLDDPVPVRAGDDAKAAMWLPAASYDAFVEAVRTRGREIYPAHTAMIKEHLR